MSDPTALVAELRERTAFRFAGDCKCGKCQLVPRELVERAAALIAQQAASIEAVQCEAAEERCKHALTLQALTAAEAERDRLVAAAETAALRFNFLARDRNSTVVDPAVGAAELRAALSTAKERGE